MIAPRRALRRALLSTYRHWMFAGRAGEPVAMRCSPREASRTRRRLRRNHAPLERPVVVISGYLDPGMYARVVARELRLLTSGRPQDFTVARFPLGGAIEPMGARVVEAMRAHSMPSVDIVGLSMGGLVGRVAAMQAAGSPTVERVFTLGTPHRGSTLAERIAPTEAARQMRPGSDFLRTLDDELDASGLGVIAYQMDGDAVIGQGNGSPRGRGAIRLPRRAGEPHLHIMADPLAILDITMQLRGEPGILIPESDPDASEGAENANPGSASSIRAPGEGSSGGPG